MDTTPRHGLPFVIADQAQKHVTVNEGLRALDALVQLSVRSRVVAAQPGAPEEGEGYILPTGATGAAWEAMREGGVAVFQDGAWALFGPRTGMTAYIEDEAAHAVWDGAAWQLTATGGSGAQEAAPRFGVNATADDTNRLSVRSDAVLHSHEAGGSVRHVLNKAAPADTASFVFQTGFSGRAEIGLTGDDDFAFKVSDDGATFREAITIDRATGEVSLPNTPNTGTGGGGVTAEEAATLASAFTEGLAAKLTANGGVGGGNLALTNQVVLAGTTGKLQLASAAAGNLVAVYPDGAALAAGAAQYRLFLGEGEVAVLTGVAPGAIVTSTGGVSGVSEGPQGPMPLAPEGFAAKHFMVFAFRFSAAGAGVVFVATGAVAATARLMTGDGQTEVDRVTVPPFSLGTMRTQADAEHQIIADQPVFAGIASSSPDGGPVDYHDARLVPPPAPEIIGYAWSAQVSALYPNTEITWHRADGVSGTATVSPGAAVSLTGEKHYRPGGSVIVRATGPVTAFAGADGAGGDATPFYPLSALGQRVPLPLGLGTGKNGGNDGIAVASPYQGTARIIAADGSLAATLPLGRAAAATSQATPCDALAAYNDATATATLTAFSGGHVEADVPIYVVQNSTDDGTAVAGGIKGGAKETAMPGVTPEEVRAEIRRDEGGTLRRRALAADGAVSWPEC